MRRNLDLVGYTLLGRLFFSRKSLLTIIKTKGWFRLRSATLYFDFTELRRFEFFPKEKVSRTRNSFSDACSRYSARLHQS